MFFYVFCSITFIQLIYYWVFFSKVSFFKPKNKERSQQHPVSIIICARDEAANLAKNLPGTLFQNYSSTREVVVVNHNSQDETRYLLEEFKKTFKDLHIVNLQQEAKGIPGKKYPLSMGIKESRHEIILLTDADCVPATEHWITRMQDGYDDKTEVVLGYGAYYKKPGLLNKLIRFEAFQTALQYFSFALSGIPYMGTGRNLSYKKDVFFRHKGFSSINHTPGGDDDLFINKVATKKNTGVVIDKEAFTLSEPKKTFGDWLRQKNRHYSTSKYYKPAHKFLLGLYALTHFLFYPSFILALIFSDWRLAAGVFVIRSISQALIYYKAMQKLDEKDLFAWVVVLRYLDVYLLSHFCPCIMEKPKEKLELITQYFTEFTPLQIRQLEALEALYSDWNSKINVISRKDEDHLYEKHILHSLSIAAVFDFKEGMSVLDLGTGGGFPGIPLAIFFPTVNFYLADSIGKKIKVVQAVKDELGLKNVTAHHTRAEDIRNTKFDTVVSRAVAPLGELWKWSKPLLKKNPGLRSEPFKTADQRTTPTIAAASERESGAEGERELPVPYGLVCLKGGDLAAEIAESGCRPRMMEIFELFPHKSFKEKFILYVPS